MEFHKRFQTDEDCYEYLSNAKWNEENFVLKNVDTINTVLGKSLFRDVACVANLMKVQQQEQLLIMSSFHF